MKLFLLLGFVVLTITTVISQDEVTVTTPSGNSNKTIEECIRNCPVTPEYNPVCGSNGVTYDNPGRFLCAQECGVAVTLKRRGRCSIPL